MDYATSALRGEGSSIHDFQSHKVIFEDEYPPNYAKENETSVREQSSKVGSLTHSTHLLSTYYVRGLDEQKQHCSSLVELVVQA